jgi:hypothetical protein
VIQYPAMTEGNRPVAVVRDYLLSESPANVFEHTQLWISEVGLEAEVHPQTDHPRRPSRAVIPRVDDPLHVWTKLQIVSDL